MRTVAMILFQNNTVQRKIDARFLTLYSKTKQKRHERERETERNTNNNKENDRNKHRKTPLSGKFCWTSELGR